LYRLFALLLIPTVLTAASDEDELVDISDIYMGIVEGECTNVNSANVITIKDLGEVALIGIRETSKSDGYYYNAVDLLERCVLDQEVKIEVCPNMPMNEKGQVRAVVYYSDGGIWLNVAIELVEEGLARVAIVPSCHVDTKAYLEYEKKAKKARRGLWEDWEE
jgi:endonuclease YncB( thermonuclease family)